MANTVTTNWATYTGTNVPSISAQIDAGSVSFSGGEQAALLDACQGVAEAGVNPLTLLLDAFVRPLQTKSANRNDIRS